MELNQAGQKKHGYVYLGGEVIAEQGATTSAFAFRHSDPLTADRGGTAPGLAFWTAIKADPVGVNVGVADPFVVFISCDPIAAKKLFKALADRGDA